MPDPPPAHRSDDTHVIANTLSPQGRKVELTKRKWAYVQHHVEMRGELELLLAAIRRCCSRRFVSPTSKSPIHTRDESATGFAPSLHSGFNG